MNFLKILRPTLQTSRLISKKYSVLAPNVIHKENVNNFFVGEKNNLNLSQRVNTQTQTHSKQYNGCIQAAILDWSGTTLDKYVIAPAVAFVEVFKKFEVPITMEEARGPMGLKEYLHIKALVESPKISQRWKTQYGREATQSDINAIFKEFVPLQLQCLHKYSTLIPNVAKTIGILRNDYNVKIGVTTGYSRVMVDLLLKDAAKQGFVPDCNVASDEVLHL